ncbi:MAG: Phosphate-induced protein 1 conserved region [Frankiaceae bacterium]|nr:Phosphate-induced protein 1 conserved region [Frankiaceae bacterium]
MYYHGGPVEVAATNYAVFWLPPVPATSNQRDLLPTYPSIIDGFLRDLPSLSINQVTWQYYMDDSTGRHYIGSPTYGGSYVDNSDYPGQTINEIDMINKFKDVALRHGWAWPGGLTHTYTLYLGPGELWCGGVDDCTGGNDTGNCGLHSATVPSGESDYLVYAVIPYASESCFTQWSPSHNMPADLAIDTTSHEFFEMQTDPTGLGWCGQQSLTFLELCGETEIADKCAWDIPIYYAAQQANQTANGHYYAIQAEWANQWNINLLPPQYDFEIPWHCIVPGEFHPLVR